MIRLVNYNGFIEPSLGIAKKGFAVRKKARVVVQLGDSVHLKKVNIRLHRTNDDWKYNYIKIRIKYATTHKFRLKNIGQKEFSIDLPDTFDRRNLELTFSVFPHGIVKYIFRLLLGKRKSLVRDSILINKLYLDENKVLNYNDKNRFAYGFSLQQNQIPVRILGFFGQTFGLAEAARRTFTSLEKSGLSVSATQIPYSGKHQGSDHTVKAEKKIPSNTDEIRLFHFNGDYFDKLISNWGELILECKYRIGFWHWELPEFPDDYLPWFDMVDEIWVPSRFVFDAIAPKSPKPVQIIPLPLDDTVLKPPPPDREKFNLPKDKIVFLITFDFYSIMERKNPICGILAFNKFLTIKDFADDVHLVIKTSNKHADPDGAKLLSETLSAIAPNKVTLIEECLSRFCMLQLINSCDSVLSVHRSEGFGLHLAEAMAMGKDIIATNWSGNTDFLNHGNSFPVNYDLINLEDSFGPYRMGNIWANPRLDDAVKQMLKVVLKNKQKNLISSNINEISNQLSINQISKKIKIRMNYINQYLEKKF